MICELTDLIQYAEAMGRAAVAAGDDARADDFFRVADAALDYLTAATKLEEVTA